ncbi:MAG: glutathione S-transferase family protein [Minicystis sp.]
MITVTAYKWVPPFAQGLVRDIRVRWALEEAGLAYQERLIGLDERSSAEHRARQPFGQVPVYEEEGLVLFESGAIVLHIGARSEALLPADPAGRARATTWVLAALNSIEVVTQQLAEIDLFAADQEWAKGRRPGLLERVEQRLADLATRLGDRAYLDDRFTAGDLVMTTVLRGLRHSDILDRTPNLKAYKERCEARPAFQKALAAQMAVFARHAS